MRDDLCECTELVVSYTYSLWATVALGTVWSFTGLRHGVTSPQRPALALGAVLQGGQAAVPVALELPGPHGQPAGDSVALVRSVC